MRRVFASMLVGVAIVGTTVWAQQEERVSGEAQPSPTNKGLPETKPATTPSTDSRPAVVDTVPSTNLSTTSTRPDSVARPDSIGTAPARAGARPQSGQNRMPVRGMADPQGLGQQNHAYPGTMPYNGGAQNPVTYLPPGPMLPSTPYFGQSSFFVQQSREDYEKAVEFGRTLESLRKAKTDEERADIRAKLNEIVGEQLDNDIAQREQRITEIETRAKELRDQLQQRKQSKAEIQKLVMMLIENPQGGLGLPSSFMNLINQPTYYQPVPQPASTYSAQ